MRVVIAASLVLLGLALLLLCGYLRTQLHSLATSPVTRQPEEFPLLERLMPATPPGTPPLKPAELARQAAWRIMSIGAGGMLSLALAIVIWLLWPRTQSAEHNAARPKTEG